MEFSHAQHSIIAWWDSAAALLAGDPSQQTAGSWPSASHLPATNTTSEVRKHIPFLLHRFGPTALSADDAGFSQLFCDQQEPGETWQSPMSIGISQLLAGGRYP